MQKRDSCQKLTEVAIYLLLVFCTVKLAKSQGTEANCYMPMVCENGRIPVWLRMSGEQYSIEKASLIYVLTMPFSESMFSQKSPLEEIYAKEITSLQERLEAIQKSVTQIRLQGVRCTAQSNPLKGTVNCSKSNHYGSICNVSCETGYYLSGDEWSECEGEDENEIGSWTSVQATCERVTCLLADELPDGGYSCTQSNEFNSTCAFRCNDGYYLVGNGTITCTEKGVATDGFGTWSDPFPQCTGIKCTPLQSITNGSVSCTATNHFNSSCRFECRKGFFLTGHRDVMCGDVDNDRIGDWSEESPSCSEILCQSQPLLPDGEVTCSGVKNGSVCSFACHAGYHLFGFSRSECADINNDGVGNWTRDRHICKAITCFSITSIDNGAVSCPNSNNYNSRCTFTCNTGYHLSGVSSSTCMDSNSDGRGDWSTSAPTCNPIYCSTLSSPSKGLMSCTNSNRFSSRCTFSCSTGYRLRGTTILTCVDSNGDGSGDWNSAIPSCEDINECSGGTHSCDSHASCSNTIGSYTCTCQGRYRGNGFNCEECYVGDGNSYRGYVSRTKAGLTCQYWTSQTPHDHTRTPSDYPSAGLGNHNYCRNPDGEDAPWCYTVDSDVRWKYCPVLSC